MLFLRIFYFFLLAISFSGVLEANSFKTTKCRQCVVNCYEYLTCKERIKSDAKTLRNLLKADTVNDGFMPTIPYDEVFNEEKVGLLIGLTLGVLKEKKRNFLS